MDKLFDPQTGSPDNFELDRQRHLGIEQGTQDTQDADETPGGNSDDSSTADTSVSQPSTAPRQRLSNYAEMEDFLRKQMQDIKVETPEERAARERREKQKGFLARLADGLGSFHRAFSYARGVQPMDLPNMSAKAQERFERAKAAREADRDRMLNYYGMLGQLEKGEREWNYKVDRDNKSDERFDRQQKRMEEQTRIQAQKAEAYRQYQESVANKNDEQAAYWRAKAQALEEGLPLDEALKRAKIAKEEAAANKYNTEAAKANRSGGGRGGRKDDGMDEVTFTENTYDPNSVFSNRVVSRKVTKTRVPRKQTSAQKAKTYANTKKLGL